MVKNLNYIRWLISYRTRDTLSNADKLEDSAHYGEQLIDVEVHGDVDGVRGVRDRPHARRVVRVLQDEWTQQFQLCATGRDLCAQTCQVGVVNRSIELGEVGDASLLVYSEKA